MGSTAIGFDTGLRFGAAAAMMSLLAACGGSEPGVGESVRLVGKESAGQPESPVSGESRVPAAYEVVPIVPCGYLSRFPGSTLINRAGQVAGTTCSQHAFFWTQDEGAVDLGTFGGSHSVAMELNDAAQVVGWANVRQDHEEWLRPFLWTRAGGLVDIGPPALFGAALGINDAGQIVGYTSGESVDWQGFFRDTSGSFVVFDDESRASDIDDAGRVAGDARGPDGGLRPFLWTQEGGRTYLDVPPGTSSAVAEAVNGRGQVAGSVVLELGGHQAFFWSPGSGATFVAPGELATRMSDLAETGEIVGFSRDGNNADHAFLWAPDGRHEVLGDLGGGNSWATALNGRGQVVGAAQLDSPEYRTHAFAWTRADGMIDLNTRIPPDAGIELLYAHDINDAGMIVAEAESGLVLLRPKTTEPPSSTAPLVAPISANEPVGVSTALTVSATFTDRDAGETYAGSWDWGDGSPAQTGTVSFSGGKGTVEGTHRYAAAGVYDVMLTVTDSGGRSTQALRQVVVYDPSAGFVTGAGWFHSPPGAHRTDAGVVGRASFGFVSRYRKGASAPAGKTEFQFMAGGLSFHSSSADWLVVSGPWARYQGSGSLNGVPNYRFALTAVDAGQGGGDRFRIRIWWADAETGQETVVYDNQVESSGSGPDKEGTRLAGGSIVIHTGT